MSLVLLIAVPNGEAATYNIEPVALDNGYEVTGGFIETDIDVGTLTAESITDYEISVTGENPFTFAPDNPGARVGVIGDVDVTATEIVVRPVTQATRPPPRNLLEFKANDPLSPLTLSLSYHSLMTDPERDEATLGDPISDRSTIWYLSGSDAPPISFLFATFEVEPAVPLSVATVPEPSAVTLTLLGVCVGLFATRKKSRFRSRLNSWAD